MIVKTDFRYGGAGKLVDYIKRDKRQRVPVKDHAGRELEREDIQRFVDASKQFGMERHIIVAPDPEAGYSPKEVDRNVRTLMHEWRSDRRLARYVYAVHDSQKTPHAHVALTGPERHLHMDKQDLRSFREAAREAFKEPERLAERAAQREREASRVVHPDKIADRADRTHSRDPEVEAEATREMDPQREPDQ